MFELMMLLMGAHVLKRHGHQIGEIIGTGVALGGLAALGPQAVGTVALAKAMEDNPDVQRWVTAATAAEAVGNRFRQHRQDRQLDSIVRALEQLGVEVDADGNLFYYEQTPSTRTYR